MNEPQAYLNGRFVPSSQAMVPAWDTGFVMGVTVAEQLRTVSARLFRPEAHLERLGHSLEIVGINPGLSLPELGRIAQELATHNHRFLDPGDDLNLTMFCTPGPYPTMIGKGASTGPTVCIHTFPLPFRLWSDKYTQGESLVTTTIEQVSAKSWPREIKCRSRMHYYLADQQARSIDSGSRALMIDQDGFVTEATTANIVAYFPGQGLVGPPRSKVLPGVSLSVLLELAQRSGVGYSERDLLPTDIAAAAEVLLTSTSLCVVPVVRFNGQPVGRGKPGPLQEMLLTAWSRLVDLDIPAQAARFALRV
jgi:branched-chain amino acid aminotransferase